MIVVITIHGIGFQQAPTDAGASDGYADALHEGLRAHLGRALGDDPNRVAAGGGGPVYAQSNWPPQTHATEAGLSRLGRWTDSGSIDTTGLPLAEPGAAVGHVALVYSGLEEKESDKTAMHALEMLSLPSIASYATFGGLVHMAVKDLEALRRHPADSAPPASNLQARSDTPAHHGLMERLLHPRDDAAATTPPSPGAAPPAPPARGAAAPAPPAPATAGTAPPAAVAAPTDVEPGAFGALRTVEDDVAAYVTRNEHRERVRMFLRDAASRLVGRADVEGIIVNGHSNGTVMGFDLIAALSPPSARRVRALITSGSPLRKYSDLFDWGHDGGNLRLMNGSWTNFWDPLDPVADPLAPLPSWRRGQPLPEGGPGMFVVHDPDTGVESAQAVTDVQVDNVKDSKGGGLRAHNYWDNDAFCVKTAEVVSGTLG